MLKVLNVYDPQCVIRSCMTDNGAMTTVKRLVSTGIDIESVEFTYAWKRSCCHEELKVDSFLSLLLKKTADLCHSSSRHSCQLVKYRASGRIQ